MPNIKTNGLTIEYNTFGSVSSPPLLLIAGYSSQMILWDEKFCEKLAQKDLYVIRFDNRDVGLSSKIENIGDYDFTELMAAILQGQQVKVPYTLDDMAADAIGLMDGLGLNKAHVLGASMGGMIAQIMAIKYPDRLLSLISMSSTTGNPELSTEISDAKEFKPAAPSSIPHEREANIEYTVKGMRDLAGPGFKFDEAYMRELAAACYDRCFYPKGVERQLLALMLSGNRRLMLEKVNVPTLVIHGDTDPLVPVKGGIDTAKAIPGAQLVIIKGLGHDLPRSVWRNIIDAIVKHVKSSGLHL